MKQLCMVLVWGISSLSLIGCRKSQPSSDDHQETDSSLEIDSGTNTSVPAVGTDPIPTGGMEPTNRDSDLAGIPSDTASEGGTALGTETETNTCPPVRSDGLRETPPCDGPTSPEDEAAFCGPALVPEPKSLLGRRWIAYAAGDIGSETYFEPENRYLDVFQKDDSYLLDAITDMNHCEGTYLLDSSGEMELADDEIPIECSWVCCDDEPGKTIRPIWEDVGSYEAREHCLWFYNEDKTRVVKYYDCSSYECIVASDCVDRPWCQSVPGYFVCMYHVCYAQPEDGSTTFATCGDGECQTNESAGSCPDDCF